MRSLYFLFLISFTAIQSVHAQVEKTAADTIAAREARSLTQRLSLSPAQEQTVKEAFSQRHLTLVASRNEKDSTTRINNIRAAYERYENTIKATLNKEQYNQYQKMLEARRAAREQNSKAKGPAIKKLE